MKHPVHAIAAAAALFAATTSSALAVTYTYSGDTTAAPIYTRSFDDFTGLSILGQDVNYQTLSFTVTTSGSYAFKSVVSGSWDNFTFLYSPSFDPAAPLANGIIGNDDLGGVVGESGFTTALKAGTTYIFVTTGFEGGIDFGAYTNTITGPGTVVAVPEPATWGLLGLGALVAGGAARRRRAPATA